MQTQIKNLLERGLVLTTWHPKKYHELLTGLREFAESKGRTVREFTITDSEGPAQMLEWLTELSKEEEPKDHFCIAVKFESLPSTLSDQDKGALESLQWLAEWKGVRQIAMYDRDSEVNTYFVSGRHVE